MYSKITKKSGFTLIEIIVVVMIISLIASVVMVALGESRERSRNTGRVAQIKEYQKAFELYYSDTGHYPRSGSGASASMCLGDYDDDACWQSGNSVTENSTISDAIVPHYLGKIPEGESVMFGDKNGSTFEGMVYTHQNYGKAYNILYFMEGHNQSCILEGTTALNVGDDTFCSLVVSP